MGYSHRYDFSKQADRWRASADYFLISERAKLRLEWMIFYYTVAQRNASFTAAHFGIARKTFHAWLKRFTPNRIQSLEEQSRTPHHLRQWEVTPAQEKRIILLRNQYPKYGKVKLKVIYQKQHQELISTWKIERVIRKHHLFPIHSNTRNESEKESKPRKR